MNFLEVLKTLDIPHQTDGHEHCRPGWVQMDCPQCRQQNHWRLGYCLTRGSMSCWSCGRQNVYEMLCLLSPQTSKKEIVNLLKGLDSRQSLRAFVPHTGRLKIPEGLIDLLPVHRAYLLTRLACPRLRLQGIIDLWGLRAFGRQGTHAWRIWIPVHLHSEIVSWTTRSIGEDPRARYRSAPTEEEAIPHKHLLYGEDHATHGVVVQEGPVDVWKIGPGAVCTFGTGYSMEQIIRISKYPVRAIVFDNEREAQKRAEELCRQLEVFDGETYNVVLKGKDATDPETPMEEINELRRRFLS